VIRAIALLSLAAWSPANIQAQSFEVAAIRSHAGAVASVGISTSGPRVTVSAMSVSNLVRYAYDVKSYQLAGGPDWATEDRWDIVAKAEGDGALTKAQARKMIEALLAERFQVKLRRETKEMAVYALVVGKGGPKLKTSAPDTPGMLTMDGTRTTRITTTNGNMEQLVAQLGHMDRPVLDKTGLTGAYDYKLEWAPDDAPADLKMPTIFNALQEQLGLKLESTKGAIQMLIIDHVEKPSPN
jgi:uncharacterized protein (TIGR03435 family)